MSKLFGHKNRCSFDWNDCYIRNDHFEVTEQVFQTSYQSKLVRFWTTIEMRSFQKELWRREWAFSLQNRCFTFLTKFIMQKRTTWNIVVPCKTTIQSTTNNHSIWKYKCFYEWTTILPLMNPSCYSTGSAPAKLAKHNPIFQKYISLTKEIMRMNFVLLILWNKEQFVAMLQ